MTRKEGTFGREAEVLVQSCTHVVSIETVARDTSTAELSLHLEGKCRLSCTRQSCEPDGAATKLDIKAKSKGARGLGDLVLNSSDICRHDVM